MVLNKRTESILVYAKADQSISLVSWETATGRSTTSWQQRKRAIYEPYVSVRVGWNNATAFPDTGASANFMSREYANLHGHPINRSSAGPLKVASGAVVESLGTVATDLTFLGERDTHQVVFNVLKTATHPITLGRPFLHFTETLTTYSRRMKELCRSFRMPRLCLLGSVQRLSGYANGKRVSAVPDTGADVSAMSAAYANRHGFNVNSAKEHQIPFQLADGSIVSASGMIKDVDWQYGADGRRYGIDVYVFKDLSVDFLLGYDVLRESDAAFKQRADNDFDQSDLAGDLWLCNGLKLVGNPGKSSDHLQ